MSISIQNNIIQISPEKEFQWLKKQIKHHLRALFQQGNHICIQKKVEVLQINSYDKNEIFEKSQLFGK